MTATAKPARQRQRRIQRAYTVAIGYLRVSKEDGDKKNGLQYQRDFIVDWAARNGIVIVDWRQDDGISGKVGIEGRAGLQEALELLRAGTADILLTYDITRVARDLGVFGAIRTALQEMGAKGLTTEGDDYTDPNNGLQVGIKALFSEEERRKIAGRLYGGRRVRSKKDGLGSGALPYGYARGAGGHVVADTNAAAVIGRVLTLRETLSYRKACEELNAAGILSPEGSAWGISSIQRIEKNAELYRTGIRKWGDVTAEQRWPAIL